MPEHTPTATDRRRLVAHALTELTRLVQAHIPLAAVEVLSTLYEDEDAHLVVWAPEGTCGGALEQLQALLTERSTAILLDTGLLILAGVYETSQQRPSDQAHVW
jgi:hypothetical protein